jgi:hypothetical protein
MNDICFELSSSWRSDKAARNRPSTTVPALFLRELRGEVRENVRQVEDGYRANRIRWGNSSVIIPFSLNRVCMPFTKTTKIRHSCDHIVADQEISLHAVAAPVPQPVQR